MYVIIFTIIFYFIELKKQEDNPFDFNKYHLILSCIMQIIINSLIKFIVYTYDEMHSTIPYFLQIFIDTIKSIIISKNDKNFKYNLMLIIPNFYLIFFLLVFIEIIIIKVCKMEKKLKNIYTFLKWMRNLIFLIKHTVHCQLIYNNNISF
jgi:hypothetical protein